MMPASPSVKENLKNKEEKLVPLKKDQPTLTKPRNLRIAHNQSSHEQ
jgi:hypothetical protein